MSSTRNSNQAVESKIESALNQVRLSKNTLEIMVILESLLADPDINERISDSEQNKHIKQLLTAYAITIHRFVKELRQLGEFLTSQLTELDNTKIDDMSPLSHTNMASAFNNLSNYLVSDIIKPDESADMRLIKLKRWINILRIALEEHDYHSTAAITAGLHNVALTQLQTTFSLLSDNDKKTISDAVNVLLKDQGWKEMETCLSSDTSFVPNLGGIKKTLTKASEAKKTYEMEAALLKQKGRLTTSSDQPAEQSAVASTKKDTLTQIETVVAVLKRDSKQLAQFTPLQYGIVQADAIDGAFRVRAIYPDEEETRTLAINLELRDIPSLLNTLHAKLAKTCTAIINKKNKKLQSDPLKPLKKYLKKIKLTDTEIITPGFADTDQFKRLLKAFRLKEFDITIPAIDEVNMLLNQIDSFSRRRIKLSMPPSLQTSSSRSASTYSTASSADVITNSTHSTSIFSSATSLSLSNTNLLTTSSAQSALSASASDTESDPDNTKPIKHPSVKRVLSAPLLISDTQKEDKKRLFKSHSLGKLSTFGNSKQSTDNSARKERAAKALSSSNSSLDSTSSAASAAAASPVSAASPASAAKLTDTPRASASGLMSPRPGGSHAHPTARAKVIPKSGSSSRLMSPRNSNSNSPSKTPPPTTKATKK